MTASITPIARKENLPQIHQTQMSGVKKMQWRGIGVGAVVIVATGIAAFWIEWWMKSFGH